MHRLTSCNMSAVLPAMLSGLTIRGLDGERGMFDPATLDAAIRPPEMERYGLFPPTTPGHA